MGPHIVFVGNQPFLLKAVDGLADGGAAHPQHLLQLIDIDLATQGHTQVDDVRPQTLVYLVHQGLFFDCRHGSRSFNRGFLNYVYRYNITEAAGKCKGRTGGGLWKSTERRGGFCVKSRTGFP